MKERNEKLAKDIAKFLIKNEIGQDTRIYFNDICFENFKNGSYETLENIKPSDYFEYANDNTVSMSFEGDLNYIINYGTNNKLLEKFNKIFDKYNCYYELGYAWSLSVYYIDDIE